MSSRLLLCSHRSSIERGQDMNRHCSL